MSKPYKRERLALRPNLKILSFFFSFSKKKLEAKQVPPPYRPQCEDERDCQNFDPMFTEETPQWTPIDE